LQIQERLTSQIARTVFDVLQPRGLAVVVEAQHMCMTTRGAYKPGSTTVTQRLLGQYRTDAQARQEVLAAIHAPTLSGYAHA
jgi:GTP cyclohydrolase I